MSTSKVIIIGSGFGGLNTAKGLKKSDVDLVIIDRTNHHLFQPMLYQVATAAITANTIAPPIREVFRKQENATVLMNDVTSIDKEKKIIKLLNGDDMSYDYLVIATGTENNYFGHDEWAQHVHGLKTLSDAFKIREHILFSFEMAENCHSLDEAMKYLRFVVVGGGPTGVEMAGAIAEIAKTPIYSKYKIINHQATEIYLIEGAPYILPTYPHRLCEKAKQDLEKMGVQVLVNTIVTNVSAKGVNIKDLFIQSSNVIWAAGNKATSLLKSLDVPLDKQGRVLVEQDLSIPGSPEIFVIGDAAAFKDPKEGILPGLAPVAMQEGRYVAKVISKKIAYKDRKPFKYFDKGSMATIGKSKAIAVIGKLQFSGFIAWLMWSFIHILYLISFRNRFIVMIEWISLYFTDRRNAFYIIQSINKIEDHHPSS